MSENSNKALLQNLGKISDAVTTVQGFSEKVKELASLLDEQKHLSQVQLNELSHAVKEVQSVFEAVSAINPTIEQFESHTRAASSLVNDSARRLVEITASFREATEISSTDFGSQVSMLKTQVSKVASDFDIFLQSVPEGINEGISSSLGLLKDSANHLASTADEVKMRLESLAGELTVHILNRINPDIDALKEILVDARESVTTVPDLAIEKIGQVHNRGIEGIDRVIASHNELLQRTKDSTVQLESVLKNSEEFERVASALERNLQLWLKVREILEEKRLPFSARFEVAALGVVGALIVGKAIGVSTEDAAILMIPATLVTLNCEPVVRRAIGLFKKQSNG
jgi:methyl-accepting chemotaxis protein